MRFDCPPWPPQWPDIRTAITATIDSGSWGSYRSCEQEQLKEAISTSSLVDYVRLCASGSAAIEIALRAAGVGPGDEAVVAAFDYPGNFRTVELVGARPVLIDVKEKTLSINPEQLEAVASDNVRAVIASHLYGNAADIHRLREFCDECSWILIEDACQVPGMKIGGSAAGSIGHLGTLSFGGSKPLTAGNGGAILTNDSRFAARIDGMLDRPSDVNPLSVMQAAALLPQLTRLSQCNELRVKAIGYLESNVIEQLQSWKFLSPLRGQVQPTHYKIAWAARSIEHRAAIIKRATELGLPMGEGFRAMARSSERRCRKPVALEQSSRFGETVFVLDHAALLLPSDRHRELGELLVQVEKETR